jgi:hypothetical protein
MYKFARHFSENARRYAANCLWEPTDVDPVTPRYWPEPTDDDEPLATRHDFYCPIGLLFELDQWHIETGVPDAQVAYEPLQRTLGLDGSEYGSIAGFMQSWDNGKIADLAAALGVNQ